MARKKINESPTISDTIVFDILTPDASGCFTSNPYKVNKVLIFYAERSFTSDNFGEYDKQTYNENLEKALVTAKKAACILPSEENLNKISKLQTELDASKTTEKFYFKDAIVVASIGSEDFPAWLSTDTDNALLTNVDEDEDENDQYGHFQLDWEPTGFREGDYFVCWTWQPNLAGDTLTTHLPFTILGNTQVTTSIPTHRTPANKYEILLDRYLPETFKMVLSQGDLTPKILREFNASVAKGFTFLEDISNQIIDVKDANATHESLLQLLANKFDLKLRTNDPTLWRRQVKNAIPLYKKKGTLTGLEEALGQANIGLSRLVKLWQIVSPYTWQEMFNYAGEDTFVLENAMILPVDNDNFELYHRTEDGEWTELNSDYVSFMEIDGQTEMIWIGQDLSVSPISLEDGDSIRVVYQINTVPDSNEQTREEYIRSLDLSDQRDERDQDYPPKNWNVRVIEEDDPLFDIIITSRHPYVDPLIYGQIRTEFPYSENIYNMEEYNGSTRDSNNPCHIDKSFTDPCSYCQSSKIAVDLEIENISDDRILEAQEIIDEFKPFHVTLHSINLTGVIRDLVLPPVETINALIKMVGAEYVYSGQFAFNRGMEGALTTKQIKRNMLADADVEVSAASGTAYNVDVVIYSDEVNFENLPLNEANNVLEILSPHAHAGEYDVESADGNHAVVNGISEPLTASAFTFRLSNIVYDNSSADIYQDDYFVFSDSELRYLDLSIKSDFDVEFNDAPGAWKISITDSGYSGSYTIKNILPDGTLILNDPSQTLPVTDQDDLNYIILDENDDTIAISDSGNLSVTRRARVDVSSDVGIDDIKNFAKIGNYLLYSGSQYKIDSFVAGETHEFYIQGYIAGDVAGQNVVIYHRLADSRVGYLDYIGLKLNTLSNHETGLPILNGANSPGEDDILNNNSFKENYLILIDDEYFAITEINGTTITLIGPKTTWETLGAGGTAVVYDIIKVSKIPISIEDRLYPPTPGQDFEYLDRSGNDFIKMETDTEMSLSLLSLSILNSSETSQITESVRQKESIKFTIEYR